MKTIEDIKDYIWTHYNSENTLGIWYDSGNYDDSYAMGKDHGESLLLYELGIALGMILDKPEYSEH